MPIIPDSLNKLLSLFQSSFTTPTFDTFRWLVTGMITRVGPHTITGMWEAVGMSGQIHHSRAHDFFAHRSWSPDQLGLALLRAVSNIQGRELPLHLVIDDTLMRRSGRKVFGANFHHDPHAEGGNATAYGNSWVVFGVLTRLPALGKTVCIPVLFRLYRHSDADLIRPSKPRLARELVDLVLTELPASSLHIVADAAYATGSFGDLPERCKLTMRIRRDAALYGLTPARTGKVGRPRVKGDRLGSIAELASEVGAKWRDVEKGGKVKREALSIRCCWFGVFGSAPVNVVVTRIKDQDGFGAAFVTTDTGASAGLVCERYEKRWAIEVCFQDAKSTVGVGQARNRSQQAVERTVPFMFLCQGIAVVWYSL